jgi:hypothetical protein
LPVSPAGADSLRRSMHASMMRGAVYVDFTKRF